MFRKFATIFGTLGILVLGGAAIALLGMLRPEIEPKAVEAPPPTVFYTIAEPKAVTLDVHAQGEVRPRTDISLTAQVSGRVVETGPSFIDGGAFEKGELLVKIEDADYRAAVIGARAEVAQAEQAMRVEQAESDLAAREYGALGRSDDPSPLALRKPQLAQARAGLEAAEAKLRMAQLDLERTEIRAPFKGRVRERIAGEGAYVSPGVSIGRIFSTGVAEIRLPLTDGDLAKLGLPVAYVENESNPGPPVLLSAVVAGRPQEWTGRLTRTEGAINPATRQITAIAVVEDPYGEGSDDGTPLPMGLYVNAEIEGRPFRNAIVLPRSALHGRDIVFVIGEGGVLDEREVNIVSAERDTVTLAGGVRGGERVAISPLRGAEEGDKVLPADPLAKSPSADEVEPDPAAARSALRGDAR